MPQLDQFVAWISIDNHPLQEYHVEYSEDQLTVTCWIASEDDEPFTINWRDSVRSHASMGRTFVDGVKCGVPKGINKKGYKKDPSKENDTACQRGAPSSSGKERQLVFSKVEYIVKSEETYSGYCGPKVGEIRLVISNIWKRGPTILQINSFQADGKVDESAKQMTPHCTKLGSFVKGDRKPIHLAKTMGKPWVFVFKYRPFEILMSLGIPPIQERLIPNPSNVKDMDTGTTRESQHQGKITKWEENTVKSESQEIKKEECMDIKIEEAQLKIEVKTEIEDSFPCHTEDKSIPNVGDSMIRAVGSMKPSSDIIDLSMDD